MTEVVRSEEARWALLGETSYQLFLLGRYCWKGGSDDEPQTKTFRTREQARKARKLCCYKNARVVKVIVTVETVPTKG